jgi:hypothetical protein
MQKKRGSKPQPSISRSRVLKNLAILAGVTALVWIVYSVLPKSSNTDTNDIVVTIVGTILGGVIILFVEYSYFQSTEKAGTTRRPTGGAVLKNRSPFLDFLKFLVQNKRKTKSRVITPSWNRAIQIALDDLKKTLEKYDWHKTDLSVVKSITKRNLCYLVVEVFDTTTYTRPVKIESFILAISKLGDIQSMDPYSVELAKEYGLI